MCVLYISQLIVNHWTDEWYCSYQHTVLSEIIHFSLLSRPISSTYQSFVPLPLLLPIAKGTSHNSFTSSLCPRIPNFLFCSSCVPDHSNHYSVLIPSSSYSVLSVPLFLSLSTRSAEGTHSLSTRSPPPPPTSGQCKNMIYLAPLCV